MTATVFANFQDKGLIIWAVQKYFGHHLVTGQRFLPLFFWGTTGPNNFRAFVRQISGTKRCVLHMCASLSLDVHLQAFTCMFSYQLICVIANNKRKKSHTNLELVGET